MAVIVVGAIVLVCAILLVGCEWLALGSPLRSSDDAAIAGGPDDDGGGSGDSDDTGDSPDDSAETYTVTYDANGATSGSAPTDQTKTQGAALTLAGNTGGLAKSGYNYAGWNTASDGSGINYAAGATYTNDADLTLYAKWTTLSTYTVTYHPNGADGGSVPADQTKTHGTDLTLAGNIGGLYKANHSFAGWTDGSGTDYAEGATYTDNAGATLYAVWEVVNLEKLLAADGDVDDWFGLSVAISGDYAIVGAPLDFDSGSAYIFHRTGTNTWGDDRKITRFDGSAGDGFGGSVAISGDYAIVGARDRDANEVGSGSAFIYYRTGINTWDGGTEVFASDGQDGDVFGDSVAISGDYAIVGATGDDGGATNGGSVYVFRRIGINTWDAGTKITASDRESGDGFGSSVAIAGDYAIVSAPYDDDDGTTSGSAYIYRRTGTNSWDTETKIAASDGAAGDGFGSQVSVYADYAIVGAWRDDDNGTDSGSAYIYRRTGTNTWDGGTKIIAPDGAALDLFGRSVAISGDYAIVGADGDDDNGPGSGSAYVFHRTGTNTWIGGGKITPSDGSSDDFFGISVATSGNYTAVGAYRDDDKGADSGSAYVFITP